MLRSRGQHPVMRIFLLSLCFVESKTVPQYTYHQPLVVQTVKNPPAVQETWVQSLGWEDSLEKRTATDSNILAWRIPWTEEPDRLQSMGSHMTEQLSLFIPSPQTQCQSWGRQEKESSCLFLGKSNYQGVRDELPKGLRIKISNTKSSSESFYKLCSWLSCVLLKFMLKS